MDEPPSSPPPPPRSGVWLFVWMANVAGLPFYVINAGSQGRPSGQPLISPEVLLLFWLVLHVIASIHAAEAVASANPDPEQRSPSGCLMLGFLAGGAAITLALAFRGCLAGHAGGL